jgi:hypothetical protein
MDGKSRFKRRCRYIPTLRQLIVLQAVNLYRRGNKEKAVELLQKNEISVYEFLTQLAMLEKKDGTRA